MDFWCTKYVEIGYYTCFHVERLKSYILPTADVSHLGCTQITKFAQRCYADLLPTPPPNKNCGKCESPPIYSICLRGPPTRGGGGMGSQMEWTILDYGRVFPLHGEVMKNSLRYQDKPKLIPSPMSPLCHRGQGNFHARTPPSAWYTAGRLVPVPESFHMTEFQDSWNRQMIKLEKDSTDSSSVCFFL